jgi:hypothetical protein
VVDLSPPAKRELRQTRSIICTGYAREDGLWDIEAHMVDTKPYPVNAPRHGVPKPAGQPLHEMKIRVTIDNEMLIHYAEAATLHAPFDACVVPPTFFPKLKGLSFKKGWKSAVAEIMGGTQGCTHLLELLGNVATVSYQTVASSDEFFAKIDSGEMRPFYLGSCYTYKESGSVVKHLYPDYYKPPVLETK